MSANPFHQSHKEAWDRDALDESRQERHASWFREDTADYWRHARMYEAAKAFVHRPDLTWVTIGDGRFGLDSIRIRKLGFQSVLPTDIGDALLEKAKNQGLITEYAVANTEKLFFADNSFDLVFCKESYHHCPRGPLALCEMLRVARHAVILVEPRDYVIDRPATRAIGPIGFLRAFKSWLIARVGLTPRPVAIGKRHLLGDAPHYEEAGNYMYTISSRELEKAALGLNLPAMALKGLNDCYIPGGETEVASEDSVLFRKMRAAIQSADRAARSGQASTSMLMAILFNQSPEAETRNYLLNNEWYLKDLPRNPYISCGNDRSGDGGHADPSNRSGAKG